MRHQSRPAHLFNLFSDSLQKYEKQTGIALSKHSVAEQLRDSDSAESVTAILLEQVPACTEIGGTDRITKSLCNVVSVLHTLSVGVESYSQFPFAKPIYAGFAILLATVRDLGALDPLVGLLESIESFLKHLDICTKVPHTAVMMETLMKTVVELLSILGLATKLAKQKQPGRLVKVFGGNFDQMVLERLDRLTLDNGWIAASQIVKVVYGLVLNMRVVIDDGKSSIDDIWDALEVMHRIVSDVNKSKRDKLQQDIRGWLLPPDPSISHKIACGLRHTGTTAWFVRGDTFSEWKWSKTSSLLWIHGKPGAGKTILCSAIIQDIDTMRRAGLVSLAYYYCDFRDDKTRDLRGLVSSLLIQLCHQSDSYCDMVSKFYSEHAKRSHRPSDAALVLCLEGVLKLPGQPPVYLIVDALDECPTTSDMPPAREKVLMLVRQLMVSKYSNLRICVTSRLEPDLSVVLEPLSFRSISLHEESGQKEDIACYIKSVVHMDPKIQAWRASDKELVINVFTQKVNGIFQWASYQFAYIRHCPREQIQRILDDLPETLDGTYRRTLRDIYKADRTLSHHLFSCVSVARRPLCAEELAELLTFILKRGPFWLFRRGWRQEDLVNAVQTTYSSLLSIVKNGDSTIIQFSHFSVQEFFENAILANPSADVSYCHVPMAPTHSLVAYVCLDVLLRLDKNFVTRDSLRRFPLAEYSAEHWLHHVRFGNLSNGVEDKMEQLFDPRKSHLAACLWIHDPEVPRWMRTERTESPLPLAGSTLHYAALWGLHPIVKFLVIERSQDVQAPGFSNMVTPLHLAAKRGHVEIAVFLIGHGADVHARDMDKLTPLHLALVEGQLGVAHVLIDHGADVHAREVDKLTPLHLASRDGQLEVACFLIDHGADVNAGDVRRFTPLHLASREGQLGVAHVLIDHGADVHAQDVDRLTPLHLASREGQLEVAPFLIDHGANVNARDMYSLTPLHLASREGHLEVARFLTDHGADRKARDMYSSTPLHLSSREGQLEVARFLIDHGADVNAQDIFSPTPLYVALRKGQLKVVHFLIDNGANVNLRDVFSSTPLHLASREGQLGVARFLTDHGADVNARDMYSLTPLHLASQEGNLEVAHFLILYGADAKARDMYRRTPLHLALQMGQVEVTRLLIEHGADVHTFDMSGLTALHLASREGQLDVARFLIDHGADVNARDKGRLTALHLALQKGQVEVTRLLIEHGADVHTFNKDRLTALHLASREGQLEVTRFLIERGADVHAQDKNRLTPLHLASREGQLEVACFLIDHSADVHARDMNNLTPLHLASREGQPEVARLLIEHGADMHARDINRLTPLHLASREGQLEVTRLLIEHGADMHARDINKLTPLHLASREGQLEVTRFLIDHSADVESRDMYSFTPLHLASREGQTHVVGVLLEHGADTDARDDANCIPLHLASQLGHLEVVHLLIGNGTDPNARDHGNWTPLHGASQEGRLNVVHFLLDNGADLHASDHGGWTSLQLPSHNGYLEIVRVLLKRGANANTQDNSHWTPLHGASQRGHWDVVRLILEHGADVDSRDDSNQTPLHVAARAGYPELVRLLVQSGADIDARNNEGQTPLEEASVKGHPNTVRLLLLFWLPFGATDDGA